MSAPIKPLASALTSSHALPLRAQWPRRMRAQISLRFVPMNGAWPLSKMYMTTPALHRSQVLSYFRARTCGAIYNGVPTIDLMYSSGPQRRADPKSTSFKMLPSLHTAPGIEKTQFSNFRSRCATSNSCKQRTAPKICRMTPAASHSRSLFASSTHVCKSPPCANCMTRWMKLWSSNAALKLMILGWSILARIATSLRTART
mmetsp:Transcript_67803/g.196074  ORF Transcript_67803/g.196074 Transcript_67803/m.196074 type:complete len:202 (-) Transcript_67803:312-917(-)